jgi:predicted acyltransferase
MTGMSVPLSRAKRSLAQTHHQIFMRVLRRFVVRFLLGSLRESISFNHPCLIELSSALQPIAGAYLAGFLVLRKSWRLQAAVAVGILVFYALLLAFVPAPGVPAGTYARDSNLVLWTDLATVGPVLTEHWGTVICALPTISTTIFGMLTGEHKIIRIFTPPLKPILGSIEPLLEPIIVLGVEWSVLYWMYNGESSSLPHAPA